MIYADHIVHAIASCQDAEQSSVTLLIAIDGSAARNLHQIGYRSRHWHPSLMVRWSRLAGHVMH